MKKVKTLILLVLISSLASIMVACSEDDKNEKKSDNDHVWKNQTDALKSAKDMAKKLQENLDQQQEKLNRND